MKAHPTDIPLFAEYLKSKDMAENTISNYLGILNTFLSTSPDIDNHEPYMDYLISTAIKKRCVQNVYALINYVKFKFGDDKQTATRIIEVIKERKIRQKDPIKYANKQPLTNEELTRVIEAMKQEKHKIMCYVMYETGLRIGDVFRIRKGSIFWEQIKGRNALKINAQTKGSKERVVWILNEVVAKIVFDFVMVTDYGTDYIFTFDRNKNKEYLKHKLSIASKSLDRGKTARMGGISTIGDTEFWIRKNNYLMFLKDLKSAMIKCNIDRERFSTHSFRRMYARRVWDTFRDIYLLKELLGHSDINTSARYLRTDGQMVIDAIEKLQLGDDTANK